MILVCGACWILNTGHAFAQESISPNMTMGNPSHASHDSSNWSNYLVVRDEYCYSYNVGTGLANWVSWRLAADDIGNADRAGLDFSRDEELPENFPRTPVQIYGKSGFDKGHWCPSKDRSRRAKGQKLTFKLPNCGPQAPALNRGPWMRHEDHRRDIAAEGKELYIVAGPAGRGGIGDKGFRQSLGRTRPEWEYSKQPGSGFDVPAWCWAVALVLDEKEGDDLKRVNKKTVTLAVIMPNTQEITGSWETFQRRVRDVEDLTGFDLFDLVDEDVQDLLETGSPVIPIPD
jgi:endonuclease G